MLQHVQSCAIMCFILGGLDHLDLNKANPHNFLKDYGFLWAAQKLLNGGKRSLAKFCRKQTPCSCLDEMHAELKQQAKTGMCRHCNQVVELKALKECSKCKLVHYCLKECQFANWPAHKGPCKIWSKKGRVISW